MTALSTPNTDTELESGEIAVGETTSPRRPVASDPAPGSGPREAGKMPALPRPGCRPPEAGVVEISPALRPWRRTLGDLWQRREIVGYLAWRDIQARYHQTTLGVLWALLQPLAATLVYAVVFGRLVKIRSGEVPYPLFVMTGLLSWQFIAAAIQRSASSLVANGGVIRKVYFPRLAIPLAAVVSSLVEFAAATLVLVGMMVKYNFAPSANLLLVPFMILLAGAMSLGIGLVLANINCWLRDVMHGTSFALQMWMFLTPVLYPPSMVPDRYQILVRCNPMSGVISGFRWVFLGVSPDWPALAAAAAWAALFLVIGGAWFRRTERALADVL